MGDIVSIKRSTDADLHELFALACPVVPDEVDEKIQSAASRALGGSAVEKSQTSFKTVCLIVVGASVLGAGLVKGFTTRWSSAVETAAMYAVQSETLNQEALLGAALPATTDSDQSWRRSKGAWAEYIARLERDPFYQYVQQEKMRFDARYPSDQSLPGQAVPDQSSTDQSLPDQLEAPQTKPAQAR